MKGISDFTTKLLPPCLLKDYVDTMVECTRAPAALHTFAGLSVVGALFARKIRLLRGAEHPIDTTQNVVLVAPSGEGKGTSMGAAQGWLSQAAPQFRIVGGKATMEGILSRLDPEFARGLVLAPELGAMFGQQKFRASFDQEMTDLLDNSDVYRWNLKGNKDEIDSELRQVAVTFLAGTTKQWMSRCMVGTALEEGFASRVLWVLCVEDPRYKELGAVVPGWGELVERLRSMYAPYSRGAAPIGTVPASFREWMELHQKELPPDPWQRGWWNRKPSMLLQIALIFSIMEGEGRVIRELTEQSVWDAAALLDWNETGMNEILTSLGAGPGSQKIRKVLSKLASFSGGIVESEFNVKVWHLTEGIAGTKDMLRQLKDMGWAEPCPMKTVTASGKIAHKQGWKITKSGQEVLQ